MEAKFFLLDEIGLLGALRAHLHATGRTGTKKYLRPLQRPEVWQWLRVDVLDSDHFFLALGPRDWSQFFDFARNHGV